MCVSCNYVVWAEPVIAAGLVGGEVVYRSASYGVRYWPIGQLANGSLFNYTGQPIHK